MRRIPLDLRTGVLTYSYLMSLWAAIEIIVLSVQLAHHRYRWTITGPELVPLSFCIVCLLAYLYMFCIGCLGAHVTAPFSRVVTYDPVIVTRTRRFFWCKLLDFVIQEAIGIPGTIYGAHHRPASRTGSRSVNLAVHILAYFVQFMVHSYLVWVVYSYTVKLKDEARGYFIGAPAFTRPGAPEVGITNGGTQMVVLQPPAPAGFVYAQPFYPGAPLVSATQGAPRPPNARGQYPPRPSAPPQPTAGAGPVPAHLRVEPGEIVPASSAGFGLGLRKG